MSSGEQNVKLFREQTLENGLVVRCYDDSRNYFGEYHLVRVILTIITDAGTHPDSDHDSGITEFRRVFERMGVPSADIPRVTGEIVDGFLCSVLPYLSSPLFPDRLRLWSDAIPSRHRPRIGLPFA